MIEPTNWWKTRLVMFIATHTPKCHDITRLISRSMDSPLPLRTRLALRIHYLICVWCERYRDQLILLRRALKAVPEEGAQKTRGAMSPDARTRLKIALQPKS
ncbi:MAG: zf-HC2 domain-containing protein [Chthoniobacter sp.]|uniref:anti-sigma factor family protein n=1 Tax=Chthoniobacter sp. TaxID=2510640 RepID=UPI0032A6BC5E